MKKQTLNEELSRIKNIMGMVINESPDRREPELPSDEAKEIAKKVLSDVMNREVKYVFDDYDFNNGEIMVSFGHEDGETATYYLDTDVRSHSSFTPGRSHMPNGDPGYPDEGTDADYNLGVSMVEIENNGAIVYKGKDFTDIMDMPLSDGSTVGDRIHNQFDEKIREWESEYDSEPDYDDYRDDD
jgi:hypothetical protein